MLTFGGLVDVIDDFISRYTREFDYYDQVGRLVAQRLEADLQASGVRSIVTSRAKSVTRLESKCRQRSSINGEYANVEEIYSDIHDLAGVRVALYFPAEQKIVGESIGRLFLVIHQKSFPEPEKKAAYQKRFSGYSASHYRIQIREEDLEDSLKRYAIARVEIQVASVLMHAWSEVEHDLVYKPAAGVLSEEEYDLLDQLNGLVMSGEIALERLQKAAESRVAKDGRHFENHFELAAYLLDRTSNTVAEQISAAGLGSVDLLFDLLVRLELDRPDAVDPYLNAVDGDLERRPLAEQIIDAILAEDQERYDDYRLVRTRRQRTVFDTGESDEIHRQIGVFLSTWVELEHLLRDLTHRPVVPNGRQLEKLDLIDAETVAEYEQLRRTRNLVVHGIEIPPADYLAAATQRVAAITDKIRRGAAPGDSAPSRPE